MDVKDVSCTVILYAILYTIEILTAPLEKISCSSNSSGQLVDVVGKGDELFYFKRCGGGGGVYFLLHYNFL